MKHQELIEKMTLEEKAALLSGKGEWQTWNIDRLEIPSIFCSDGPHGIRKQAGAGDHLGLNPSLPATCFPTAATVANSWDPDLGEEIGRALGEEAAVQGVNVVLGPGLNIKRSPLCGRNFEYFSEDPYLAGKMAAESAVLLKNEENILPLFPGSKVAVIGDFAVEPRYQGAGSSVVNPTRVESIEKVMDQYDLQIIGINRGYKRNGETEEEMKKAALDLASAADIVLYFFGLDELSESEGMDCAHMRIPQNQIELLEAIVKVNSNIVGIISAGSAIEMPWNHSLKAILHGYLNGQAGAGAIMDIRTGKVNPSGRLNETCPLKYEDTPSFRYFPSTERNAEYREGLFVGYRYYDTSHVRVLYPFGYGLSYTSFAYSDLKVDEKGVTFTISNTGDRDGAETAQLYVGLSGARVFRPEKELKGFRKVYLKAGEQKEVRISFDDKTFRYWNVKTGKWEIEEGEYQIMVGACVSDIRLTACYGVKGTTKEYPYEKEQLPSYTTGMIQKVEDAEFTALLGHPIPNGKWSGDLGINDAICQMYYAKSSLARFIYRILTSMKNRSERKGKPDLNILFIYNMPFRGIAKMTGGAVSMKMAKGMVDVVNGHFLKGMKQVIGGFFENRKENKLYERKLNSK